MGKVEDMRALREAMRATQQRMAAPPAKRGAKRAGAAMKGIRPALVVVDEVASTDELCGHRSIGNKSCTRPAGHAEKNHRYGKTT